MDFYTRDIVGPMMTETEAREFRANRDAYARTTNRQNITSLRQLYRGELALRGQEQLFGGPAIKAEFVSALVNLRYPPAKVNESTHVLYHGGEFILDVCAYCNPNPCPACGALEGCEWTPELGAVVNGRHVTAGA